MSPQAVDTFEYFLCQFELYIERAWHGIAFQGKSGVERDYQQQALWKKDRQKRRVHISVR